MQQTNKRFFLFFVACFLTLLLFLPGMARADNDPEAEPVVSTIADKLIIQLGPEWAGTEFSLTTDMGVYPGVITVNDAGILTTELGGSTTYTLVCLQTSKVPEGADPVSSAEEPAMLPPQQQATVEILPPQADTEVPNTAPDQSGLQTTTHDAQPTPAPEEQSGIPTLHLVLFIGGVVLCIGGLIVMRLLKHRSEYYDEEDDE